MISRLAVYSEHVSELNKMRKYSKMRRCHIIYGQKGKGVPPGGERGGYNKYFQSGI